MSQRYPKFRNAQRLSDPYRRFDRARRFRRSESFGAQLIAGCLMMGITSWNVAPQLTSYWRTATKPRPEVEAVEHSVYYRNCADARAAGAAPIYRGSPGYREGMDGDSDGIACEPFRGS